MRLFKVAGISRPLDSKNKIDMILDFLWKNGIMLDKLIDFRIRESISEGRLLQYYESHSTYKYLKCASKCGLGVKVHVSTGHKKKNVLHRRRNIYKPNNKHERKKNDIFKRDGDSHKPSLGDLLEQSRASLGKKKPQQWVSIVSVPMGGQNKKY
ncbi:MAG: hypothetical protein IJ551_10210 [Prevotella sp.]|nr:hypothetical protein [Prevotella sp.]